ncbi:MAG TPA: hypothetical protein VL490_08145 [Mucilaginibacter sp.]|jgi:hypothetical protein|nr:hypothetical protein [Mucilaginibacter sp.]
MSELTARLNQSIKKGVSFLSAQQLATGEFRCYMANNDDILAYDGPPAGWVVEDSVVFPTTLIGNSLLFVANDPVLDDILNKVTIFFLAQRKAGSAWNHYVQDHPAYMLCPFDVDDTACASAFLKARNVDFPSNRDLIEKNINRKKLFYTWFALRSWPSFSKAYWRLALRELKRPFKSIVFWYTMPCDRTDVDAVVNANALFYLGKTKNSGHVIKHLLKIIENRQEAVCDKWYRNVLTVYYFFSRTYHSGVSELNSGGGAIIERVLKLLKPDGSIGESVLDTALAVCTLLNFDYNGPELMPAIQFLLANQTGAGNWPKRGFYYNSPKKEATWGSEELTTGICLEALARYKDLL